MKLLLEAAVKRGWTAEMYPGVKRLYTILTSRDGDIYVVSDTLTELNSVTGCFIAKYKDASLQMATKLGIETPPTLTYTTETLANDFLNKHKKIVVKPNTGGHADGITFDITTPTQLSNAVKKARQISDIVLLQAQVVGDDYRLLVIGNKVAAAARRNPPTVTGNGKHTVEELVKLMNSDKKRGERYKSILTAVDPKQVKNYLGRALYNQVLPKGQKLPLLPTGSMSQGGLSTDVTDQVSPVAAKLAVSIAQALGLGVCGVDIISPDISSPNKRDHIFLEVNSSPGLRMHHFPHKGQGRDAAGAILRELENRRKVLQKIQNTAIM